MQVLHKLFTKWNFLILIVLLLFINLGYLDYLIYKNGGLTSQVKNTYQTQQIQNLVPSPTIALLDTPTLTPAPFQYPQQVQAISSKEFYIPFGSGSVSSTDWTDVAGLQAYIDSTAYQNISQVIFEVSLHIPTGNEVSSVRLVNATDGRVISGSQLDFNGNTTSVLLSSSPISLDYGKKLYKIQIKTQLGYSAILDQSRVHITTK